MKNEVIKFLKILNNVYIKQSSFYKERVIKILIPNIFLILK